MTVTLVPGPGAVEIVAEPDGLPEGYAFLHGFGDPPHRVRDRKDMPDLPTVCQMTKIGGSAPARVVGRRAA